MACCLQVENLTKSFGDLVLFENISFAIEDGRRVALVAKNGTGKTTLLNIIAGREDHDGGEVVPRRDLRIAYLEQSPEYPAEMTVLEACFHSENPALKAIAEYERAIEEPSGEGLQEAMARMDALEAWDYEQRAKRILSRLKIRDFGQRVGTLSGGQLKRVALANALISESDLLILDEPTNHLDIVSKEILENALKDYTGTVLYVSHDRYFINQTATRILELTGQTLVNYIGNYDYYLEKKEELTRIYAPAADAAAPEETAAPSEASSTKLDWKAQKEEQARLRKKENELKKTEKRIEELETRDSEIDEEMSKPEVATNVAECVKLSKEKAEIAAELEELYEKWEELAE